ncbi:hypothetical protein [Chelativorans sp. M5D2P16]|uniref:hypothetical protein n=1 Tax=Chelativorans sp. M5D2P16 TaxID=3095678 RepID=UPI002ACAF058|nr:hypothetical protein [Chelativorans sp. M5D2P16]MDZ5697624.1 hypothetical protein [Chelativorans sp. M5D2P16]
MRSFLILTAFILCAVTFSGKALAQDGGEESAEPFAFDLEAINEGLPPADPPLQLDTPLAAIEAFLDAVQNEDFARAAHVLNLNAIPVEQQSERGPELALRMAFVLRRFDLVDWSELPDQPDARVLRCPTVGCSLQPAVGRTWRGNA